ncbi:short-chain fatty acid transporter [Emcibacter nanhaiensis]|uniref:Short-chain fatty acid transporter n=1 Tax=Emcibacter nanhaiensis TaxID=1505037 RepID=A0A501PBZ4_9PROT|nr:TIGR00366 family protein [Emcibacter nanhaiensis]TPD57611.1 short-chain fatty acid transporter [Emcibacter nanhaiensis]
MKYFQLLAKPFTIFVERYYPDPFVFAILLTLLTYLITLGLTDITPMDAVVAWGDGLASLLSFMAQLAIMLIAAHALAHTDSIQRCLRFLGGLPKSQAAAYLMVTVIAGLASLLSWSLGLVAGAILAQQVAIEGRRKGLRLHFPLLVASAYAGFVIWHMGYSASAPLFVATPGNALEGTIGGLIPVTDTIFAGWNILIAFVTLALVAITCSLMRPKEEDILEAPVEAMESMREDEEEADRSAGHGSPLSPAGHMDNSRLISIALGLFLMVYLVHWFSSKGLNLNLNIVNWSFLALGLILARNPLHYVGLIGNASRTVSPVLLQYPLYAGIMGLMFNSGLVNVMSDWFTSISTPETLPFWAFISGGLVNFFVPSGGGQWAIQGPVFIDAAQKLGVDLPLVVMGVAYGDQWTNMIQPFWTIPLLAIAGLHMRQIMGYTFVIFLVTFLTFGGGLLIAAT